MHRMHRIKTLASILLTAPHVNAIVAPAEPRVFCTQDVALCPDQATFVGRSSDHNCRFELCPGAACVLFDQATATTVDNSNQCAGGFACKGFQGSGSVRRTCQPLTCAAGEEWDAWAHKCVGVSCTSALACMDNEVCTSKSRTCVRAPCPQFECVAQVSECNGSEPGARCNANAVCARTSVYCGRPFLEMSCACDLKDGWRTWLCLQAVPAPCDETTTATSKVPAADCSAGDRRRAVCEGIDGPNGGEGACKYKAASRTCVNRASFVDDDLELPPTPSSPEEPDCSLVPCAPLACAVNEFSYTVLGECCPTCNGTPPLCCLASTATCLACRRGVTVAEFCEADVEDTVGCTPKCASVETKELRCEGHGKQMEVATSSCDCNGNDCQNVEPMSEDELCCDKEHTGKAFKSGRCRSPQASECGQFNQYACQNNAQICAWQSVTLCTAKPADCGSKPTAKKCGKDERCAWQRTKTQSAAKSCDGRTTQHQTTCSRLDKVSCREHDKCAWRLKKIVTSSCVEQY